MWWGYKVAEHFSLLISDLSISHGLLLCSDTELHHSHLLPRSAWSRCAELCCRQNGASGMGTGAHTTDSPRRYGAEGHRKPPWSLSLNMWPRQFEKKTPQLLIKCRFPLGSPLTVFWRTHLVRKLCHHRLGWLSPNVNPNTCYWVKACLCTTQPRAGQQQQL